MFVIAIVGAHGGARHESLSEACRAILNVPGAYIVEMIPRMRTRHVAFFNGETKKVAPMFEATPTERKEILSY